MLARLVLLSLVVIVGCAGGAAPVGSLDGGPTDAAGAGTGGALGAAGAGTGGGVGFGGTGGIGASGGTGGTSAGAGGATGGTGGASGAALPRLLVSVPQGTPPGVAIWNNVDSITVARAADLTLIKTGGSAPFKLALVGERLFVGTRGRVSGDYPPVVMFDGIRALTDGQTDPVELPLTAFSSFFARAGTGLLVPDGADHLWVGDLGSRLHLFSGGATVTSTSTTQATFNNDYYFTSLAYDGIGKKLIGVTRGTEILVWNDAGSRTGEVTMPDWTLATPTTGFSFTALVLAGDRLYANRLDNGSLNSEIWIWKDVSRITAGRAPDAIISNAAVTSVRDNVLYGARRVPAEVQIFRDADALATGASADRVVSLSGPAARLAIGKGGRLYLTQAMSVDIYDNVLAAPALVASLPVEPGAAGGPGFDLLLVE
jgi:hypothetical protein